MPRISGRSALTTLSPIRCSPSERSESRCAFVPPILDLVWVTFSCAIACSRSTARLGGRRRGCPRPEHRRRGDVLEWQATPGGDLLGSGQALERRYGRVHYVDRVG